MPAQILTTDDLNIFKIELLDELKKLFSDSGAKVEKQWMKSPEVRKFLGISPGTLQNLRINGTLSYTKVGGVIYYQYEDIMKMLNANKKKAH
jgi:hypothetical protein